MISTAEEYSDELLSVDSVSCRRLGAGCWHFWGGHSYFQIKYMKMKMTESYNPLKRQQDLQTLTSIIVSWNSTRLDLFELTLPNEDLEFSGR